MQNVQVFKELSAQLPKIVADFGQIQQVCTNLIMNAIQAMRAAVFDYTYILGR
jgi:signal transduction histidine kinase